MMKSTGQQGFSLVELMVALALGLILTLGVLQIFNTNKQTFRLAEASARAQESSRLALELLQREIRNADGWGCYGGAGTNLVGAPFDNLLNLAGLDAAVKPSYDFGNIIGAGLGGGTDSLGAGAFDKPDFLIVAGSLAGSGGRVATISSGSSTFEMESADVVQAGDLLAVTDCAKLFVLQATAVADGTDVTYGTSGGSPANLDKQFAFDAAQDDVRAFKLYRRTLAITEDAAGMRSLTLTNLGTAAVPMISGVHDVQMEFGVDNTGDGSVDEWKAPVTGADANRTVAVRISVLGRAPENNSVSQAQQLCYPGWLNCTDADDFVTAPSRHYYSVSTATVAIRNRVGLLGGGG